MRRFRAGKFERNTVPTPLRNLTPHEAQVSLTEIDPAALAEQGYKLVLLDVDNTLLPWKAHELPQATLDWCARAKSAGLQIALVSNTRHPERLKRLAQALDVPIAEGKFKPSPSMYRNAVERAGVRLEEAVMIGDQLFTDVLGANRAGIASIWIRPMARREFVGTKFSRFAEFVVGPAIYRAMINTPGDLPISPRRGPLANRGVRQFVKFVVVGGSSTIIDWGLTALFMGWAIFGGRSLGVTVGNALQDAKVWPFTFADTPFGAGLPVMTAIAAGFAILNSYYWNRRWTFRAVGHERQVKQISKFFTIALIGLGLNTVITTVVFKLANTDEGIAAAIGKVTATAIVLFWNFFGQKYFTFRQAGH